MILCPVCGSNPDFRESHAVAWCVCTRLSLYGTADGAWRWYFEWQRPEGRKPMDFGAGSGLSEQDVRSFCGFARNEQLLQEVLRS